MVFLFPGFELPVASPGWQTENKNSDMVFCWFDLLGRQLLCQCWCKGNGGGGGGGVTGMSGMGEEGTVPSRACSCKISSAVV